MIRDTDTVFVIVADCGGGDDGNPHTSMATALERVSGETGIDIYRTTFAEYEQCEHGEAEHSDVGVLVYENW